MTDTGGLCVTWHTIHDFFMCGKHSPKQSWNCCQKWEKINVKGSRCRLWKIMDVLGVSRQKLNTLVLIEKAWYMRCKYTVSILVLRTDDSLLGLLARRQRGKTFFYVLLTVHPYIHVNKTNLMHSLPSVYFVSRPLCVSSIFVAHHQEIYCIYTTVVMYCAF